MLTISKILEAINRAEYSMALLDKKIETTESFNGTRNHILRAQRRTYEVLIEAANDLIKIKELNKK